MPKHPFLSSILSSRWQYLIALLAGACLTLAFAPFEWRLFAILSPAILFYLLHNAVTTRQHQKLSYIYALGMFATGKYWLYYSMYFFAHAPFILAAGITALFVVIFSIHYLFLGTLTSRFTHVPNAFKLLVLFPASWVFVEWLRSWVLTGFPWLFLGYSHIDNPLVNIAPIMGSLGVSLLSAMLSGALVLAIISPKNKAAILKDRILAGSIALAIISGSYLLGMINWTEADGKPIKVSLLQGNIPQDKKWLPETREPTLTMYKEMSNKNWDSDLIIWPETAIPGYFSKHLDDVILPLQQKSIETYTDLLIGGFFYNYEGKAGAENSILAIAADVRSIYSKHHLVPFSEYVPFLEYMRWLEKWIQLPYDSVKRGTGPTTLKVAGITAQMSVCYEDAFGNETIRGLPEATMLINVSNDGWFTGSIEPQQHMEIARMRSVETGRYMLRGTNIGVSGIINEKGKIITTATAYTSTIINGTAQPFAGATPYVRVGNWLIVSLLSMVLIFSIWTYRSTNHTN